MHCVKKHRYKPIRRYCDLCSRFFDQKHDIVDHISRDHLKLRLFECKRCEFKSYYKQGLEKHMLQHGLETECKVCQKRVKNMRDHLKNHVKVKCPICSKPHLRINLKRHMRTHDKKNEIKSNFVE